MSGRESPLSPRTRDILRQFYGESAYSPVNSTDDINDSVLLPEEQLELPSYGFHDDKLKLGSVEQQWPGE